MEATIKFNLDEEYDAHNYELINQAIKMQQVLWEYDQKLRAMYKYENIESAYEYRQMLRDMLIDKNINHLI